VVVQGDPELRELNRWVVISATVQLYAGVICTLIAVILLLNTNRSWLACMLTAVAIYIWIHVIVQTAWALGDHSLNPFGCIFKGLVYIASAGKRERAADQGRHASVGKNSRSWIAVVLNRLAITPIAYIALLNWNAQARFNMFGLTPKLTVPGSSIVSVQNGVDHVSQLPAAGNEEKHQKKVVVLLPRETASVQAAPGAETVDLIADRVDVGTYSVTNGSVAFQASNFNSLAGVFQLDAVTLDPPGLGDVHYSVYRVVFQGATSDTDLSLVKAADLKKFRDRSSGAFRFQHGTEREVLSTENFISSDKEQDPEICAALDLKNHDVFSAEFYGVQFRLGRSGAEIFSKAGRCNLKTRGSIDCSMLSSCLMYCKKSGNEFSIWVMSPDLDRPQLLASAQLSKEQIDTTILNARFAAIAGSPQMQYFVAYGARPPAKAKTYLDGLTHSWREQHLAASGSHTQ
jgi:hypothetical protein